MKAYRARSIGLEHSRRGSSAVAPVDHFPAKKAKYKGSSETKRKPLKQAIGIPFDPNRRTSRKIIQEVDGISLWEWKQGTKAKGHVYKYVVRVMAQPYEFESYKEALAYFNTLIDKEAL